MKKLERDCLSEVFSTERVAMTAYWDVSDVQALNVQRELSASRPFGIWWERLGSYKLVSIAITSNVDHNHTLITNLNYVWNCKRCKKAYTGETGRTLVEYFPEHLKGIHKMSVKPVSIHFNSYDHQGKTSISGTYLTSCPCDQITSNYG